MQKRKQCANVTRARFRARAKKFLIILPAIFARACAHQGWMGRRRPSTRHKTAWKKCARARFCYDDEPLLVGHYKLLNRETSILPPPLLPDFTPFFGLPFSVWFFFSLFSILERVAFFKDVSPFLLIISGNSFLFDNFFSTNLRWIRIERVYASTTCWNLNYSVSLL